MGNLSKTINNLDLIDRMYRWRQATVNTENLVIYHDAECKEIKHVCEVVPDVGVTILARAFSVEAIRLCYASRFMVSSNEIDSMRVSEFQANKQGNSLDAKEATIDVVAQEKIICVWTEAANLEDLNHIKELPVYVANYSNRCSNVNHIALFH